MKDIEPQQIRAELAVMKDTAHDMARRMNRMLAQQRQHHRTEPAR
ncbi:hypothetical protein [Paenibacillus thermotolerans]|nr:MULTISPECIES: hypothetical protein [unclassified Paenibacillus]